MTEAQSEAELKLERRFHIRGVVESIVTVQVNGSQLDLLHCKLLSGGIS